MIEFENVTKRYADGSVAVRKLNLQLPSRKTTVLVGSSGCGKTTLLRMINRMVEASLGTVSIDGTDVRQHNPVRLRRSIGYVLQNGGLFPHLQVVDNVAAVLRLNKVAPAAARTRALEMLELVGLETSYAKRYPHQLSGGQQQRVGVARALAGDPNILLMDEPFGAVDPIVRTELQSEVLRLQREMQKTIVFVTHDIDEAFLLGDQVAILEAEGEIVGFGTPSQIIEAPPNAFVAEFVGTVRGSRALHTKATSSGTVLVDTAGRTQGVLVERPK